MNRFLTGAALACSILAAQATHAASTANALLHLGSADFPNLEALFYPGAFLVDTSTDRVHSLCLPFRGRMVMPSAAPADCPVDQSTGRPDPRLMFRSNRPAPGDAEVIVGNLGLSIDQRLGANHPLPGEGPAQSRTLSAIGMAVKLNAGIQGLTWDLNSASLPSALRYEVPGSGLFMHLTKRYAPGSMPVLFPPGSDSIVVSTTAGFSRFSATGSAAANLTIVLGLQTDDDGGTPEDITLVIGIFNSRGHAGEGVRSDGRNQFVATPFSEASSYIQKLEGPQLGSLPSPSSRISLKLARSGVSRLIADVNAARTAKGASPLSLDLSKVLLKRVDLRNEDRFLDRGDIQLSLNVNDFSVVRSPN